MFKNLIVIMVSILLTACVDKTQTLTLDSKSATNGNFVSFSDIAMWDSEDHVAALQVFYDECASKRLPASLKEFCAESNRASDAKLFFETNFQPFLLHSEQGEESILTGYYEPQFAGSLTKSVEYRCPLYKRPKNMLRIELGGLHKDLEKRKLRGRLVGKKVLPYYSRSEINAGMIKEKPLCYLKSDVDRFFLQVQGSGRVLLENSQTMFVGYDGQNGHPYRSIGKAFVESGEISQEEISLQSIRVWLDKHPDKAKGVLESNPSFVFFDKRKRAASGSLGVELSAMRSVAVDRSKIPLGYPLFLSAVNPITEKPINRVVYAQDTGGAIKGQVRADLFCGFGTEAEQLAGELKSPLQLYLLVPKVIVMQK
ncbi:MAG: murein transglycosylase A [Campylobacterota bacterium]